MSASVGALALACSAPPGVGEEDEVPDFIGALPGTVGAPAAAAAGANGNGAVTGGGSASVTSNEGQGSVPLSNDTYGGAQSGASGGAGGSGASEDGAGGSAMVFAGGNGAGGASAPSDPNLGGGAGGAPLPDGPPDEPSEPTVDEEPIGPAPVEPPPVEPAPVEPAPVEPAPVEPAPVEPPPVQPPPQPLPGGLYFIDDFEGGRDPQWTESEVGGGAGAFTIDTSLGANGSSSSMRIDANGAFHTMLQFALPQAVRDANELFGRVYLRLEATPSQAHFIWVEVGNTMNDQHEMRLGHNVGRLQSNHFLNGEQDIRDQSRQLVADQWYCLEFFMDNAPEQLRVFLDGEETALSTNNYTAGAGAQGNGNPVADFIPPLEAFRIGWELQDGTVWFDDVALGSQRIGCD